MTQHDLVSWFHWLIGFFYVYISERGRGRDVESGKRETKGEYNCLLCWIYNSDPISYGCKLGELG